MTDPVERILDFLRRHRFVQAEAAFKAELLLREEERRFLSPLETVSYGNPQLQSLSGVQSNVCLTGNVGEQKLIRHSCNDNAGSSHSKEVSALVEDIRFPPEKQLYVEYEPRGIVCADGLCTISWDFAGEDTSDASTILKSDDSLTFPNQTLDRVLQGDSLTYSRNKGGGFSEVNQSNEKSEALLCSPTPGVGKPVQHTAPRPNEATKEKQQSNSANTPVQAQLRIPNQEYHEDVLQEGSSRLVPGIFGNLESEKSELIEEDKASRLDFPMKGQQMVTTTNRLQHCGGLALQWQDACSAAVLENGIQGSAPKVPSPCCAQMAPNISEQLRMFHGEEMTSTSESVGKICNSDGGNTESPAFVNRNSGLSQQFKDLAFYPTSNNEPEDLPRLPPVKLHSWEQNMATAKTDGSLAKCLISKKLSKSNILQTHDGSEPTMHRFSVIESIVDALPDHVAAISNAADGWHPDDYCGSDTYEDDDDPGYHRQPIEDEEWFLAHEIDYPSDEEKPRQFEEKFSGKDGFPSTKVEEDGQSHGEESYFSGEEYYGLQAAKEDNQKTHLYETRKSEDDNLASFNVQQLECDKVQIRTLGNDLADFKNDMQAFETREPHSAQLQPLWKGYTGHPVNPSGYDSDFNGCKINSDADDENHRSVRYGGIFVSSDAADVGSEQRDSVLGLSSEGDAESLKEKILQTHKPLKRSFGSKKSQISEQEVQTEVRNESGQHFEESNCEHDLVLQYYNEAWGLCKRSIDKEIASRKMFRSMEPPQNQRLTDCTTRQAFDDNGGSMFEGFSFPSPSSTGEVAISAAGSGRSLMSNKESAAQDDETVGYGIIGMIGPDDTLAVWRQKSKNSSPVICSSEDNLHEFELPSDLTGSFQVANHPHHLMFQNHGGGESKLTCQLVTSQLSIEGEEEALDGQGMSTLKDADDDFEVFNLRIIHRKNRTGFEEEKDFPILVNSIIAGRYHATEYLGSAAFSKAIQAHDLHTGMDVCMKIIKNNKDFFDQSLDEIKLLKFINQQDPADKYHILRLYDYFYHREHLFIVCELLRANLYEFHKFNRESGGEAYFTMPRLQSITRQCLEALEFLHRLGIIHCDLKPENILVKSYSRCEVKIIDLGSSCFETDHLCSYVQSRSYRAPEVILGLPYDQKIDVWSLGCILAELCTGKVLFQNDSLATLLARVVGILGPIDPEVLAKGHDTHKYFTKNHMIYERNQETDQLEYLIPKKTSLAHRLSTGDHGFVEFVRYLLQCNPSKRPRATAALQHPWLSFPYEPMSS